MTTAERDIELLRVIPVPCTEEKRCLASGFKVSVPPPKDNEPAEREREAHSLWLVFGRLAFAIFENI